MFRLYSGFIVLIAFVSLISFEVKAQGTENASDSEGKFADSSEDMVEENAQPDENHASEPPQVSPKEESETVTTYDLSASAEETAGGHSESVDPGSYQDILSQVDAQLGSNAPYHVRMEAVWKLLRPFVEVSQAPAEAKVEALERFSNDFPKNNRHLVFARKLVLSVKTGRKIKAGEHVYLSLEDKLIKRTERFGLKLGVGVFGGTVALTLFTVRYEYFYWTVVRGQGQIGWSILGWSAGTGFGIPIKLGEKNGRRELRIGLALEGGFYDLELPGTYGRSAWGPLLLPEIEFCARAKSGLTFTSTLQVIVFTNNTGSPFVVVPHVSVLFGFAY